MLPADIQTATSNWHQMACVGQSLVVSSTATTTPVQKNQQIMAQVNQVTCQEVKGQTEDIKVMRGHISRETDASGIVPGNIGLYVDRIMLPMETSAFLMSPTAGLVINCVWSAMDVVRQTEKIYNEFTWNSILNIEYCTHIILSSFN